MGIGIAGFGLGYRAPFYGSVLESPPQGVDWFEVVSENFMGLGGRPFRFLSQLRERYPVAMHGVSLSLASREPVFRRYLGALRRLVDACDPAIVSDHLCWTSHGGRNSHDLLPVLYTEATLAELTRRLDEIQTALGRRLYLENPSAYAAFAAQDMDEATFLAELVRRSGCGLLLDVNNLYVNHRNLGLDPLAYLDRLPGDAIGYYHVAGHSYGDGGVIIDTHDHAPCDEVWALYRECARRWPAVPTLLEWDDRIPELPDLVAELQKARAHHGAAAGRPEDVRAHLTPASPPQTGAAVAFDSQDAFFHMMTGELAPADPRLAVLAEGGPVPRDRGMRVYHDAYFLRLRDCLRDMFPTLAGILTGCAFDDVIRRYLRACPPEHYSIKHVGERLATFLAEGDLTVDFGVPRRWLGDVARIEWLLEEIFDAPNGEPPVGIETLAEVPPEAWGELRLLPRDTIRTAATEIDVGALFNAVQAGEELAKPVHDPSFYVVFREGERVGWEALDEREHAFFTLLLRDGRFHAACEAYASRFDLALEEAVPEVLPHLRRLFELEAIAGYSAT